MALNIGELVAKITLDHKGFDKGLAKSKDSFMGFSDKLTGLAAAGGAAAALALGGALLSGLDDAAVGAKIAAQLGHTTEMGEEYGKIAGELYADNFGASVAEIGDVIATIQKMHLVPEDAGADEIKAVAAQAQTLVDVFGQDMVMSTNAAAQMIKTGLAANATEAFDIIARGSQEGIDKAGDLSEVFNEYSTQFRELGLTGVQSLGLLGQGLRGGARDADVVADALKEFAIRAKDGSKTSADGFKLLGLNGEKMTKVFAKGGPEAAAGLDTVLDKLKGMKDPVDRNAAAVALFGTQSEDLQKALLSLDLDTATRGFDNTAGAVDRASKAVGETDAAKLETFKREVMETAKGLAADLVPHLKEAAEWFKKNEDTVKPVVTVLAALAAGIIAVNIATKIWAATEAAFTVVKTIATGVQWAWNAALMANPIGLIIIGIIALIAVIVLIATKTTWFQDLWKVVWGAIKGAALAIWDWMKNSLWPGIKAVFTNLADKVIWVKDKFNAFTVEVIKIVGKVKDKISDVFSAIGNFIADGFNHGKNAAKSAVNSIIGFANGAIGGLNAIIRGANRVPGINLPTIPTIPKLARGGSVAPSPGGTPVIMGDGGEVEYGMPQSKLMQLLRMAMGAGSTRGATPGAPTIIHLELPAGGLLKGIRDEIKARGGNVQVVLSGVS